MPGEVLTCACEGAHYSTQACCSSGQSIAEEPMESKIDWVYAGLLNRAHFQVSGSIPVLSSIGDSSNGKTRDFGPRYGGFDSSIPSQLLNILGDV